MSLHPFLSCPFTQFILFHTPNFIKWIQASPHLAECNSPRSCLTCRLIKTWRQLRSCKEYDCVRPASFVDGVRELFCTSRLTPVLRAKAKNLPQEDAHEFVVFLLQRLDEEFLEENAPEGVDFISKLSSPISRIFGGWQLTKCTCSSNVHDVQEAINNYVAPSQLSYHCIACGKESEDNFKQFQCYSTPNTLMLQLQRFRENGSKISSDITINQSITVGNGNYEFMGAVLHIGTSSECGHYIAVTKCPDNRFSIFDDKEVTSVRSFPGGTSLSKNAYILIYSRQSAVVYGTPTKKSPFVVTDLLGEKTVDKASSSQSSNDYNIVSKTHMIPKDFVGISPTAGTNPKCSFETSPMKQLPVVPGTTQGIVSPLVSSSQSSHDYNIITQTHMLSRDDELGCTPLSPERTSPSFQANTPPYFQKFTDLPPRPPEECIDTPETQDNSDDGIGISSPEVEVPLNKKFQPIVLYSSEVPGALLPKNPISSNSMQALKRWLMCRGLPQNGKKEDLVERIALVIGKGKSHILDPKIDKGKWYQAKADAQATDRRLELISSQSFIATQQGIKFPSKGWKPFPSADIPSMFNYGHIYFYTVESRPTLQTEESDTDSGCEEDQEDQPEAADPLEQENFSLNEVQVLRKGLRFLKSKFVRGLEDVKDARCYYVRGHVRASMKLEAHTVSVALSLRSGNVQLCECDCIQRSLGRCSHVCAVLLHIWSHIKLNGYGGKISDLHIDGLVASHLG
ncbi:Ubiquitin carboxyl-terminal hydrolase 36 [Frankliniella fusca]|uniref:ubiquitinyl hydrolase 1 n=1 Tax=Frankliniella fusca TaxID=407009 RepID=A0AAE1HYP0_9NEOP|nr:Ubiquitin carboxyl-terminal hydrolase 36 [Frankliniella fusca]